MRELELDGIHDDGEHVLLVDSDGERYTLRIDRALRAAVRSDRPALNMIQATDAAPLRPREIQAMLRAGRSAEDIAEASEIPLEHVRRYEGPVLAEREWTAQRARTFPVGRGGPALQEVVTERLAAREVTGETAWDAWRRQDGTWTLELSFSAGGRTRQAHWIADIDNRSVSPVDDEARWISDDDAPVEPLRGRGRLQAVRSTVYDLEADGSLEGEPASSSRARTWLPRRPAPEGPAPIDDAELDALNARRGLRSVPRPDDSATVWSGLDEEPPSAEDAHPSTGAALRGPTVAVPAAGASAAGARAAGGADAEDPQAGPAASADKSGEIEDARDLEAATEHDLDDDASGDLAEASDDAEQLEPAQGADQAGDAPGAAEQSETVEDGALPAEDAALHFEDTVDLTPLPGFNGAAPATEEPAAEEPKKAKKRQRSKRASMPSWDEIVFGSKHE